MADNIMGPEVNLGLNVNLELDRSAQDASTLADQIRQMRIDQEAFRDVIADTQDRLREMTSSYQEQLALRQQLLETEQSLRNLSDSRTDSLRDQVNAFQEMESSMSRLTQMMGQSGGMGMGGYGMGAPGMGGGFYNPMSGMMGNFGGFPGAFSAIPEEEEEMAEVGAMERQQGNFKDKFKEKLQNIFYTESIMKDFGFGNNENQTDEQKKMIDRRLGNRVIKGFLGPRIYGTLRNTQLLGNVAEVAGVAGRYAAIPYAAYKIGSDIAQTGQEYGTLTGDFNPVKGYENKLSAFFGSEFGLNPLMPYGVSKEINNMGLASGYGSSAYQDEYRSFASGAFERYGMSPQESQKFFQEGVVRSGGSLQNLAKALDNTARTAASAGISFAQAKESLIGATTFGTSMGLGANASTYGSIMATQFSGYNSQATQNLQNISTQYGSFFSSITGQALEAQAMGTSWSHLYSASQAAGGLTAAFQDKAIINILGKLGLTSQSTSGDISDAANTGSYLLTQMGFQVDPQTFTSLAEGLLHNQKSISKNIHNASKPKISDYQHHVSGGRGGGAIVFDPAKGGQEAYDAAMKAWQSGASSESVTQHILAGAKATTMGTGKDTTITIKFQDNAGKVLSAMINSSNADYGKSSTNGG